MTVARTRFALCAIWLLAAASGAWFLAGYGNAPGGTGQTPQHWPAQSEIALPPDRPLLVMFTHPQCACSRASVAELNRLMARCPGAMDVKVLFIQPPELPHDWTQTALWKSAAAIPGVSVEVDSDGAEARRFGAESSGYVVLYNQRGELLFNGGITSARAQAGDNAGANVIVSLVTDQSAHLTNTPVFGCGLFDDSLTASN